MSVIQDVFKWGNPLVRTKIFSGQAGVYSNFNGYKQMIQSSGDAQKQLSTWLIAAPLSLLVSGITKGVS